jgi:hypothetical protein
MTTFVRVTNREKTTGSSRRKTLNSLFLKDPDWRWPGRFAARLAGPMNADAALLLRRERGHQQLKRGHELLERGGARNFLIGNEVQEFERAFRLRHRTQLLGARGRFLDRIADRRLDRRPEFFLLGREREHGFQRRDMGVEECALVGRRGFLFLVLVLRLLLLGLCDDGRQVGGHADRVAKAARKEEGAEETLGCLGNGGASEEGRRKCDRKFCFYQNSRSDPNIWYPNVGTSQPTKVLN